MSESEVHSDSVEWIGSLANGLQAMTNAQLPQVLVDREAGGLAKHAAEMIRRCAYIGGDLTKAKFLVEARGEECLDVMHAFRRDRQRAADNAMEQQQHGLFDCYSIS